MTVVVTGAQGTIGQVLCAALRAQGHAVFGIDRFATEAPSSRRVDVANYRELHDALDAWKLGEQDMVMHLAAEPGRVYGSEHWEDLWRTNCIGLRNVLQLQERLGFRLVWFSTSEVYGDRYGVAKEQEVEDRPCVPLNDYGITKLAGELMIRNSPMKAQTVIVRPFNCYGPPERPTPYRSIVGRFLWAGLQGRPLVVYRGSRCWMYIDDLVAPVARIPALWDHQARRASINLGVPWSVTNLELARACCKAAGAPDSLIALDDRGDGAAFEKQTDFLRAVAWLGYHPRVELDEGLRRTVQWLRSRKE